MGRPPTTLVGGDAPTTTLGKSFMIVNISLEHTFVSRKLCILYTQQFSSRGVLPTFAGDRSDEVLPFNVMEDFDMRLSHDRLTSFLWCWHVLWVVAPELEFHNFAKSE